MKSTKSCEVLSEIVTVKFENPDEVYKPGLPYTGMVTKGPLSLQGSPAAPSPAPAHPQPCSATAAAPTNRGISPSLPAQIRLQRADGSGLPQRQVLLSVRNQGKEKTQIFLTDSSGRASFQLVTSGWRNRVSLRVSVPPVFPPQGSWSCFLQ